MHVATERPENLSRSSYHVLSSMATLILLEMVLNREQAVWVATAFAMFAWTCELSRRHVPGVNELLMRMLGPIAHRHEWHRVNSATWYGTGLAFIAPVFATPTLALAVVCAGLGDPAAGFIGRRYGRTKLVHGRSLEGTIAYAVASFLGCLAVLALWHGNIPPSRGLLAAGVAAVTGALTELFASKIDDNFIVPITVSLAVGVVFGGAV